MRNKRGNQMLIYLNETLTQTYFNNQKLSPQNINTCVIIAKPEMAKTNQIRAMAQP